MRNLNSPIIFTSESFSVEVEKRFAQAKKGASLLEVATDLMAEHGIDPEDGGPLISTTLKQKIAAQCRDLNLLKEKSTTRKLV